MNKNLKLRAFSDRLCWTRKQKNRIQQELSLKTAVPQSTIASYETGARASKGAPKGLFVLAKALEVDTEWLLTGNGEPYNSNQIKTAIKRMQKMDEQKIEKLLKIMDVFSQPEAS